MNLIVVQLAEVDSAEGDSPVATDSAHSDNRSGGPAGCRYVDLDVADSRVSHIWEVLSPDSGAELKVAVADGNAGLARVQWQYAWDTGAFATSSEGDPETQGRVEGLRQAWREYLLGKPMARGGGKSGGLGDFLVCHKMGAVSSATAAVQGDNHGPYGSIDLSSSSRCAPRAKTPVHPVGVYASRIKEKEPCEAKKETEEGAESITGKSSDFSDWKMLVASRRAGDPSFGARVPCSLAEVSSSGHGFVTEVVPIQSLRLWLQFEPSSCFPIAQACQGGVDEGPPAVLPSRSLAQGGQTGLDEAGLLGDTEFTRYCSSGIAPRHVDVDILLACPRPKVVDKLLSSMATFGVRHVFLFKTDKVEATYFAAHQLSEASIKQSLMDGLSQGACYTRVPTVRKFPPKTSLAAVLEAYDSLETSSTGNVTSDTTCGKIEGAPNRCRIVAHPYAGQKISEVLESVRWSDGGTQDCGIPPVVTLAIGPEGGWTDAEMCLLEARPNTDTSGASAQYQGVGFERVSLGPRILKTLDAMLAMLALVYDGMES